VHSEREEEKKNRISSSNSGRNILYFSIQENIFATRKEILPHKKRNDVFQNQILFLKLLTTKCCRIQRCLLRIYTYYNIFVGKFNWSFYYIMNNTYIHIIYTKNEKIQLHLNNTHTSCTMVLHFSDEIHNECKLNNSR